MTKHSLPVLLLLFSYQMIGQSSFSLKEAVQYGLSNNAEIKNAALDMEISEKKVWETTAMGLPQVSAKGEFQNFIDIPTTLVPASMFNPMAPDGEMMGLQFGTKQNINASLQVSQLIFSGNYLVGLQASKTYSNLSQQAKQKKELDVKESITSAYYTVLVLQANKSVLDSTLKTVNDLLAQTKVLVAEKMVESTNASQLELSVLQVQNAINQVDHQIAVAKNLLKFNMGYKLEQNIELTETMDNYTQLANEEVPLTLSSSNNLDYQLLETQQKLNELNLKNTKANYLPSLYGFFSHQQAAMRNEFNFFDSNESWFPTTLWGITLEVPIFSSGQKMSQVNQAKLEVEKSTNSLSQLDEGLKLQMAQATADYQVAQDSYLIQEKSADVAATILNNTIIKYKEGVVSSIELTQAQNQYLQVETELVNASFNLINAKLKIDKLQNKL